MVKDGNLKIECISISYKESGNSKNPHFIIIQHTKSHTIITALRQNGAINRAKFHLAKNTTDFRSLVSEYA